MNFIKEAVLQNPHWKSGKIDFARIEGAFVEREVFPALEASARRKFVTVLRGLRRAGKSFLSRQIMSNFLRRGIAARELAWFEFDRAMNASSDDLDDLLNFFEGRGAKVVVLDEIPFVSSWQDVLKRHYDRSDVKFVVTGSSALELDRRTSESLAGRFETINVKPFSFGEFLAKKGIAPKGELDVAKKSEGLFLECEKYLRVGGLPEIALDESEAARRNYVVNSLLGPLFYKDVPAVFPNANPDFLSKTAELLAATVGSTFQLQNFAPILGCSLPTVSLQLELLERALLVSTSFNKTASIVKQKRTAKKIVFSDNGVLSALWPDVPLSSLAENAAASALEAKMFWREPRGKEVDVLIPSKKLAVEVKYQNNVTGADEKGLECFLEKNKGWRGMLVTKHEEDARSEIPRLPLWKLLLKPSAL